MKHSNFTLWNVPMERNVNSTCETGCYRYLLLSFFIVFDKVSATMKSCSSRLGLSSSCSSFSNSSFSSFACSFSKCFQFFPQHFGDQKKLLKLGGRTMKHGPLNWPNIAHLLTEIKWYSNSNITKLTPSRSRGHINYDTVVDYMLNHLDRCTTTSILLQKLDIYKRYF